MVEYKRWKFIKLGFDRYRVITPNRSFTFDIIIRGGIKEIQERVDLWTEVTNEYN